MSLTKGLKRIVQSVALLDSVIQSTEGCASPDQRSPSGSRLNPHQRSGTCCAWSGGEEPLQHALPVRGGLLQDPPKAL